MAGIMDSLSNEKNVLSAAKYLYCSCHVTWLPCKTSIVNEWFQTIYILTLQSACGNSKEERAVADLGADLGARAPLILG